MDHIELPSYVTPKHYEIHIKPVIDESKFFGFIKITVAVNQPTSTIVLNSVDLTFEKAVLLQRNIETNHILFYGGTAALEFEQTIEEGEYDLQIEYEGKINASATGLFVSAYQAEGVLKQLLLTQFEAVAARKFIPCWDEPARKATFGLSVTFAKDQLAVSNMPIESIVELEDGLQRISFQKSPRMSSYLLFLAVGDLERLETTSGSTTISIVARKGSANNGSFALDAAKHLLSYYNTYFDFPYPLPKLDLVACPGAGGFSAMENWGAILYFETQLLLNPQSSTETNKQRVFTVVAHEMAHQWFGNLVTMEWWDNLWLNEGFASWMQNKATEHFHPEWKMWLQSEADRQKAMRQDAKYSTHAVVQPVLSGDQAEQAFDDITYQKGQAVVRMLENYLTPETFMEGVRAYIKRYAYKNAVSDNLWAEMETARTNMKRNARFRTETQKTFIKMVAGKIWKELEKSSEKPIKLIADEFTRQPGVPLISIDAETVSGEKTTLTLTQERFAVDESQGDMRVWHTPVLAAAIESPASSALQLIAGQAPSFMAVDGKPPVKINIGQGAYFRSRYSVSAFSGLATRFNLLPAADQLGLLYDLWALGEAGAAPIGDYLGLTKSVPRDADTTVWQQMSETFSSVDTVYAGLAGRPSLRAYARSILGPTFARIGWAKNPDEADNIAVLRENLLIALGRLEDPSVLDEARKRFDCFLANPEDPRGLPPDIRLPGLRVIAHWANEATYESLHNLAIRTTDPMISNELFVTLASAQDVALAARSLDMALTAKTTGPRMIARVALDNPDLAWRFALDHFEKIKPSLDDMQRYTFIPSIAVQSTNPDILPELRRYIDDQVPPELRKAVERYFADLQFRLKFKAQRIPEIDHWISSH